MTQEEKAKAYDEALERAKKLLLGNEHDKTICTYFEHVFPELKESEGETIRKALLDFFRRKSEKGFEWVEYGIPNNAILSWLKEQKEEKGQNEGQKIVEYPAKCALEVTVSDDERAKEDERIRKQIEQAIIEHDWSATYKVSKEDCLAYLEKQKEQKPASISCGHENDKPAEWSEEDKYKVAVYLHDKDGGMVWSKAEEMTSEILDILRPQPHWKLGKEQMDALETAASILQSVGAFYEQLKKLM